MLGLAAKGRSGRATGFSKNSSRGNRLSRSARCLLHSPQRCRTQIGRVGKMIPSDAGREVFVIAWEFQVKAEHREDFERAYGPSGDWLKLFRTGEGYPK